MSRIAFLATMGLCVSSSAASAQTSLAFAWVRADQPNTAQYNPVNSRSHGTHPNRVRHTQDGVYFVDFADLEEAYGGNVQVSAYGTDNAHCNHWWLSDIEDDVTHVKYKSAIVVCYTPGGDLINTRFSASYAQYTWAERNVGYVTVDDPIGWEDPGPVDPTRYNSSNDDIVLGRLGVGTYFVRFYGQGGTTPGFRVGAYGLFNNDKCRLGTVPVLGGVGVVCTDATGNRVDTPFTLAYENGNTWTALKEAHLVSDENGVTSNVYTEVIGTPTSVNTSTGRYTVRIPGIGLASSSGAVFVNAIESALNDRICKAVDWQRQPDNAVNVYVRCVRAGSNVAESSRFSVHYMR